MKVIFCWLQSRGLANLHIFDWPNNQTFITETITVQSDLLITSTYTLYD